MHKITAEEMMSWKPCVDPCVGYPRAYVESLFGDGLTPLQTLELDIPVEDRIWVAYHYIARHDRDGLRACVLATVDRAVRSSCLICGVPDIESWAQRWLDRADGWDDLAAVSAALDARDARDPLAFAVDAFAVWAALASAREALASARADLDAARADMAARAARYALDAALYASRNPRAARAARAARVGETRRQIEDVRKWMEKEEKTKNE